MLTFFSQSIFTHPIETDMPYWCFMCPSHFVYFLVSMLSIAILWTRGGNPPIVFISVDWATRNHRAMIITVVWKAGGISKPDISEIELRTLNGWSPWPSLFPSGLYNKHLARLKTSHSRSFTSFLTIHYKTSWIPKFKSLMISKGWRIRNHL